MRILFLLFSILLVGCATTAIDPKLCGQVSWERVGHIDGRDGRPKDYKIEHQKSCQGRAAIEDATYDAGWEKGRSEYCTPANAYDLGLWGVLRSPICPPEQEKELAEAYAKGSALRLKRAELHEVEKKIAEEKERRDKDESVVNHISQAYHLLAGTSPTQKMENQAAQIRDEVNRLEVGAPPRISTPAYEAGVRQGYGILRALGGSFLGFGAGHAFQGRYKSEGWKWTVGEVAMFGSMIAVSRSECPVTDRPSGDVRTEPARCASAWPTVSFLAWLGFRVWQSVDLFSYESRSRYAFGLSPEGIQVVYHF